MSPLLLAKVAQTAAGAVGWIFLTALTAHKDSALCVSAQTAERRTRARAACTHAGAKDAWNPVAWTVK